jgi:serine/threonine-protein kinase PknG
VPAVAVVDPAAAVMPAPEVPERARFCGFCGSEVGRGRAGAPGSATGTCAECRQAFSFAPGLCRDDLVGGQYRVVGCLAYGGLGWIYLAQDERVSRRWVVLKGMLNARDPEAVAAAVAERQFLARVEHPNVVRIYNFVQHEGAGYIVMEYVGGRTLAEVVAERGRLPVELAVAYVLGVLPAFGYLHRLGLLYNDLKPANVILQGEEVKLVDLGAVTRLDDPDPAVWGSDAFQAPEVEAHGPSVVSDLYTVARCLASLVPEPGPHDSLRRFLARGTARRPERRFQSAGEMADQLLGVLRQVVAATGGRPAPAPSGLFGGDLQPFEVPPAGALPRPEWRHLPPLGVDRADLGMARALVELGDFAAAEAALDRIGRDDWRATWYRGVALLAQRRPVEAGAAFDRVCAELPGELAPRLAMALAAEQATDLAAAGPLYGSVVATDPGFTSACFGLGRVREALGDRSGAVAAYGAIAPTSSLRASAQVAAARALLSAVPAPPSAAELALASSAIERLGAEPAVRGELSVRLLETALAQLSAGSLEPGDEVLLLGRPLREQALRLGLEAAYRDLARLASGPEKVRLVDLANRVRPRTRR